MGLAFQVACAVMRTWWNLIENSKHKLMWYAIRIIHRKMWCDWMYHEMRWVDLGDGMLPLHRRTASLWHLRCPSPLRKPWHLSSSLRALSRSRSRPLRCLLSSGNLLTSVKSCPGCGACVMHSSLEVYNRLEMLDEWSGEVHLNVAAM